MSIGSPVTILTLYKNTIDLLPGKLKCPPENQWLEDVFPIEIISFWGDMLVFGGIWVFPRIVVPQNGRWKSWSLPYEQMDDLGGCFPLFSECHPYALKRSNHQTSNSVLWGSAFLVPSIDQGPGGPRSIDQNGTVVDGMGPFFKG